MTIEPGDGAIDARPTRLLSPLTLFQISIFWFALNTIWGGFELFQQERIVPGKGRQFGHRNISPCRLLAFSGWSYCIASNVYSQAHEL